MNNLLYAETQYMGYGWIATVVLAIMFTGFITFFIKVKKTWRRVVATGVFLLIGFIISILSTLRLKTFYYANRIEYQFVSIMSAKNEVLQLDSVISVKIITYDPETYGGWGLKGDGSTVVYSTSGNKGIIFGLKNGTKLLLGTHQPSTIYTSLKGIYPVTE